MGGRCLYSSSSFGAGDPVSKAARTLSRFYRNKQYTASITTRYVEQTEMSLKLDAIIQYPSISIATT